MGRGPEADLSALAGVLRHLCCPVCAAGLEQVGSAPVVLGCVHGHRYDVARQGHVTMVPGGTKLRADTADMVAARQRVLDAGVLDPVRDALVRAVAALVGAAGTGVVDQSGRVLAGSGSAGLAPSGDLVDDRLVVDVAAGTGWYTAAVLDALPGHLGLALELSAPALRLATRAHPRLAAVGTDLTRQLPLSDGAVGRDGALTAVFAPLPTPAELARVSRTGAGLVVVTPTPAHLSGLRVRLGLLDVPAGKPDRLAARLATAWQEGSRDDVVAAVPLDRRLAGDVVAMGPNAWHVDERLRAALADLPEQLTETVAVTVSRFTRR